MRLPRLSLRQVVTPLLLAGSLNAAHATTLGPQIIASPNDRHHYRAITLDNDLQVVLIQDPGAAIAAAQLIVQAGANQDPDDMPGLAHFLEHMVHLGTRRYPEAGSYQAFISKQGGIFNATTSASDTQYFFSIPQQALPEAVERFSQLLAAPLFNADFVDRERHAVDAEFNQRLHQDDRRLRDVENQLFNPQYPGARFSVGNLDTLKDGDVSLRQRLLEFHRQHYSANRMRLAVSGPQSLDALQKIVETNFSAIPNKKLPAPRIDQPLFDRKQLPAQVEVRSLSKMRRLSFVFPVPVQADDYRYKPMEYLARLLANKEYGGLEDRLKRAGLASTVKGSIHTPAYGNQALITVEVSLSAQGASAQDRVQATLFAYLDLIRQQGLQGWRYDELVQQRQLNYRFPAVIPPIVLVGAVASNMAYFPLQDAVYANWRMDGYERGRIQPILDALRSDNVLRVYQSDKVADTDRVSPWYKAPYRLQRPSPQADAEPLTGLSLPGANRYLARDLEIRDVQMAKPTRLDLPQGIELWYEADKSFGMPTAVWLVDLQSPTARSARQHVLLELLAGWWNDSLKSDLAPASWAGLNAKVGVSTSGITLQVGGWRDQQQRVLEQMLKQLCGGAIEHAAFTRLSQGYLQKLQNERRDGLSRAMMSSLDISLLPNRWLAEEQRAALESLSVEDLRSFRDEWLAKLHVQALAIGNLGQDEAERGAALITHWLSPRIPRSAIAKQAPRRIPAALPEIRPDTDSQDAAVLLYVPSSSRDTSAQAASLLLGRLIKAPFGVELRTNQQLGYTAQANSTMLGEWPGLVFLVRSHDYSSAAVVQRMNAVLADIGPRLAKLDETELQPYREGVLRNLERRSNNLGELAGRRWQDLQAGYEDFQQRSRLVAQVRALTPADLRAEWQRLSAAPRLQIVSDPGIPANIEQFTRSADTLSAPKPQDIWQPPTLAAPDDQATTGQL
ncbi:insulinase family protein [Pseudomonas sp.]|uniref:insulinase family protein n=1 Tax=Pseudomonas sp. TaxID=306 RepID=UPI0028B1B18E|nr:insulinase family protein [Pseudomonas sp.]